MTERLFTVDGDSAVPAVPVSLAEAGLKERSDLQEWVSSAAATVAGVRTEIVREQCESGEATRDIAETFSLPIGHVLAALSHVQRRRPLRVAA